MNSIEGDYEEIVTALNLTPGLGVEYSESHGVIFDDEESGHRRRINYGLFSVCEDYNSEHTFSNGAADMSFNPEKIQEALNEWDKRNVF